jgi:acyl carrier protein|tara:strand:- start:1179 stop:1409 length:231 start_codon:yes stop_codon:yes gene_type:complete
VEDIIKRIKVHVEEITFRAVGPTDALYSSNLIDSMGTIDLAVALEGEFNISIDTRDVIEANFDSLEKLGRYVKTKL